jgi:hypothetical protein
MEAMTFQFHEGERVALKADRPGLGLRAGAEGVVWALYATEPPAYEVSFRAPDGASFDVTLSGDELLRVTQASPEQTVEAPAAQQAA